MATLIRVLRLDRVVESRKALFVYLVILWGIAFLPRMWPDLLWAIDGTDATDFEIFAGASWLAWAGDTPYAVETCFGCAYRYSPVFAYLFLPFAVLGSTVWLFLHLGALLALPLRIARVMPFLWPFWWDVGVGSNMIFVLVLSYHALKGRGWAIAAVLGISLLAPRPLMLPIIAWLLWQHPRSQLPFVFGAITSVALAYGTGHLGPWIDVLRSSGSEVFMAFNVGPSAVIGGWWPLIGIPLAVLFTKRGQLGIASLMASPYWIPYYLQMGALPKAVKRSEARDNLPDAERIAWFEVLEWINPRRVALGRQLRPFGRQLIRPTIGVFGGPALLAAAIILDAFRRTAGHWTELVRPMTVGVVAAILLPVLAWLVLRRAVFAAVAGVLATVLLLAPHQLYLVPAIVGVGAALVAAQHWERFKQHAPVAITPSLAIVPAALLVAIVGFRSVIDGVVSVDDFEAGATSETIAASGVRELPDIYVLLLDGYPRSDDLLTTFRYDNEPFYEGLAALGFQVYPEATSEFRRTELTLASSMLEDPSGLDDADAIHAVAAGRGDFEVVRRAWREIRREYLVNVPTMDQLRSFGYRLTHVSSAVSHVEWTGWDLRLDTGHVTDFETALIQESALAPLLGDWVMAQHRDRMDGSLELWTNAARAPGQQLLLGHVMAPHTPFLYGRDEVEAQPPSCWYSVICSLFTDRAADLGMTKDEYVGRFVPHLEALNRRVLAAVRETIVANPSAVVVVMSDHGTRFSDEPDESWVRTLFAARVPHDPDALADDPGPDGLFPRLLKSVLELQSDRVTTEGAGP